LIEPLLNHWHEITSYSAVIVTAAEKLSLWRKQFTALS